MSKDLLFFKITAFASEAGSRSHSQPLSKSWELDPFILASKDKVLSQQGITDFLVLSLIHTQRFLSLSFFSPCVYVCMHMYAHMYAYIYMHMDGLFSAF